MRMHYRRSLGAGLVLTFSAVVAASAAYAEPPRPTGAEVGESVEDVIHSGWNVLNGRYLQSSVSDMFTFEWQYFMVHDAAEQFKGSIGFVLVDPKARLGSTSSGASRLPFDMLPSGPSVAVGGFWGDGSSFSNYERLGSSQQIGVQDKTFAAADGRGYFAELKEVETVTPTSGVFSLKGKSADAEWDLEVSPDWTHNNTNAYGTPFGPVVGTDVGPVPGERWTVHMQWPRTKVQGTMKNLRTGVTHTISGHGYRENAWGRFNFAFDGWAFAILSDARSGVQWAWQTYHRSKDMDWLDVSFEDDGKTVQRRFFAKDDTLRWKLGGWSFHREARKCIPNAVEVVAQDAEYRIRAKYDLAESQTPMLSSATALTKIFVIMVHTPMIRGTIERVATGEVVASFEGRGGGEFSTTRSILPHNSPENCEQWGQRFAREYAPTPFSP
jgi:hypothetical protein